MTKNESWEVINNKFIEYCASNYRSMQSEDPKVVLNAFIEFLDSLLKHEDLLEFDELPWWSNKLKDIYFVRATNW